MSKGSRPRPLSISHEELANRLEGIFGKKPPRVPYVYQPEPLTTVYLTCTMMKD